jgi:hypothetical protein
MEGAIINGRQPSTSDNPLQHMRRKLKRENCKKSSHWSVLLEAGRMWKRKVKTASPATEILRWETAGSGGELGILRCMWLELPFLLTKKLEDFCTHADVIGGTGWCVRSCRPLLYPWFTRTQREDEKTMKKSHLSCSLFRFFFLCGSFVSVMWGLTSKDPIEWSAAHLVSVHRVVARKLDIGDHFLHKPVTRISYCTIGGEWCVLRLVTVGSIL